MARTVTTEAVSVWGGGMLACTIGSPIEDADPAVSRAATLARAAGTELVPGTLALPANTY